MAGVNMWQVCIFELVQTNASLVDEKGVFFHQESYERKNARLDTWPRGVTVSTLGSESSDRGSNPREAFQECHAAFREFIVINETKNLRL